jgi:hypothetical protein
MQTIGPERNLKLGKGVPREPREYAHADAQAN